MNGFIEQWKCPTQVGQQWYRWNLPVVCETITFAIGTYASDSWVVSNACNAGSFTNKSYIEFACNGGFYTFYVKGY